MPATLLTRDDVLELRQRAETGHWDNVAGVRLLREAERVIRPVLRATAGRHRVPVEELAGMTMRAAWQALRRYDPAKSPDPWGWVAAAARRAAGDAAVIASTGHTARGRARLAVAVEGTHRRLTGELGRPPDDDELLAALKPDQQVLAARIAADGNLVAFTGVAAPMLTYDESILDLPAPSQPVVPLGLCPRLSALAKWLAADIGAERSHVESMIELAADLAGDLIPVVGVPDAVPRIVDELTQSPLGVPLTRETARRIVDALLAHAQASLGSEGAAA